MSAGLLEDSSAEHNRGEEGGDEDEGEDEVRGMEGHGIGSRHGPGYRMSRAPALHPKGSAPSWVDALRDVFGGDSAASWGLRRLCCL